MFKFELSDEEFAEQCARKDEITEVEQAEEFVNKMEQVWKDQGEKA